MGPPKVVRSESRESAAKDAALKESKVPQAITDEVEKTRIGRVLMCVAGKGAARVRRRRED